MTLQTTKLKNDLQTRYRKREIRLIFLLKLQSFFLTGCWFVARFLEQ